MPSLTERIHEADRTDIQNRIKNQITSFSREEQLVFLRYLKSAGAEDLAQKFF